MNLIVFNLILFGNLWIWKMLFTNPAIGLLAALSSTAFYFLLKTNKSPTRQIFVVLFILLLILQWKTTEIKSLTDLSNDQKRIQDMRLKEYPPVKISLFGKDVWIPIAHWFEGRRESVAFFRIVDNFSVVVDPNLYFFANHPRQRIGVKEFEKFPYIFLPFFIYGALSMFNRNNKTLILFSCLTPVIFLSLIGNQNLLGPFSLFPFLVVTTTCGLIGAHSCAKKIGKGKYKWLTVSFIVLTALVLIQICSYEVF